MTLCHILLVQKGLGKFMRIDKALPAIDKLKIFGKFEEIKRKLFLALSVPVLLLGCTTWNLTKLVKKKREVQKDAACCFEKHPGGSTLQNNSCMATCLLSYKPTSYHEPVMLYTAEEIRTNW